MTEVVYVYAWGNNERRAELKGRLCVVEARGKMSTVLVRFCDTGERVTTSRRALRRAVCPCGIPFGVFHICAYGFKHGPYPPRLRPPWPKANPDLTLA